MIFEHLLIDIFEIHESGEQVRDEEDSIVRFLVDLELKFGVD